MQQRLRPVGLIGITLIIPTIVTTATTTIVILKASRTNASFPRTRTAPCCPRPCPQVIVVVVAAVAAFVVLARVGGGGHR